MVDAVRQWRDFERVLHARGLDWGLHYAPAQLRCTRAAEHRHGAALEDLLPADYRAFVAEVGYPVLGYGYYDREGLSFLPPEPMARISVDLPGPDDVWPEAVDGAPTTCGFAFFAGHDLSDIEGYAFGPGDRGAPAVWLVEGGMAREVAADTFTGWLAGELDLQRARIDGLDAAEVAAMLADNDGEDDPHRLLDYSLGGGYDQPPYTSEDLELAWVEKDTEVFGLVDGTGAWLLPPSRRFRVVRPFRDGLAQVVLKERGTGYSGPWTTIRPDGRVVTT